ncbi:DUF4349 domain-containing protein [Saccharothrix violaceirubra]|uniref:DUF4349 domain-containing protein n=1 Tax=Saccharothrix violaceirubra TaxID=413306 RepID=A0A7W7SXF5_9PSEU|nr:DUF4349 domain-containing protein [Saccharothrix violaceirubra]MBB4962739.1 hypothetical protein [Saccharothrix violaceirubra]
MRRLVAAGFLVMATLVAGCSTDLQSASAPAVDAASPPEPNAGQAKGEGQPEPAQQPAERQVVRTAEIDLRTSDVPGTLGRVKEVATRSEGFVATETSRESSGSLTLRVPAAKLDAVLKAFGDLPDVKVGRREVRSEDVTGQLIDVDTRTANQRASVERLRALLDRAGTTAEIAQIEGELTRRQTDLESSLRRQEALRDQVALSTVQVGVTRSDSSVPVAEEDAGFLDGLAGGWGALRDTVAWLLMALGAALPWLAALGIVLFLGARIRRWWRNLGQTPAPAGAVVETEEK